MVLLLLTSARERLGRRRASAIVCDDLLGLRRRSGRRGGAPLGRRKGNNWKSFLGLGIVSHNSAFVARIFLQARAGDAAAAASDERRGQDELAEVRPRIVEAHAQRQRQRVARLFGRDTGVNVTARGCEPRVELLLVVFAD